METLRVEIHNVPRKFKNAFNSNVWEVAKTVQLLGYTGKIKGLESHRKGIHYTIEWKTVVPIRAEEGDEDTIEFLGERITRKDFKLIYSNVKCAECREPLKFENGNIALDDDYYVCRSCEASYGSLSKLC